MDISIIYEDEDLLVINKPSGITVNNSETTKGELTLQDWAAEKFGKEFKQEALKYESKQDWDPEVDFFKRAGIVHRLDKETSGLLILAKNPKSFAILQNQFKERQIEKTYVALSHGKVVPEKGQISVPVGRLPWNRTQFGVVAGGRESLTFYEVIGYFTGHNGDRYSYLELNPKTGRTHQIRVHLKYIGHPIFSDFLYAGRKTSREDRKILSRVFLHAAKISFLHPKTGEKIFLEAPIPFEFSKVFENLKREN